MWVHLFNQLHMLRRLRLRPSLRTKVAAFGVLALAALLMVGCSAPAAKPTAAALASEPGVNRQVRQTVRSGPVDAALARGEQLYQANCVQCHGERGVGAATGPTFLTPIYAPDHHSDQSFVLAVRQGVRPHHWNFGPMPPVPGVSDADLREIISYVRWFQGLRQ